MTTSAAPDQLITAPDLTGSTMARYLAWVRQRGLTDARDYDELWRWSVDDIDGFWRSLWRFFDIGRGVVPRVALAESGMPGARWFPSTNVNYAEQVFRQATDARPALVVAAEGQPDRELSWQDLERQVGALAQRLRDWGVRPGDRVVGYLPNIPAAVVALLASASVGAVWSCCAPEYGTTSVVERFSQIEPKVLLVADGYRYGGHIVDRRAEAAEIAAGLPTVENVIAVPYVMSGDPIGPHDWFEVTAGDAPLLFEQVPFDHPLWILYSSGTTGLPKALVHGHGGIVVEHLKWLALHDDVRPGDRFFWYTTTTWMVWNVVVGSLLAGATAVLYDGSPTWPDVGALWALGARTRATHLGVSAGYVSASQKAGIEPGAEHDFSSVRCVMFGGAPLPRAGWRWIHDAVKADVWLDSPSGGTDVCAPFVGGTPLKPVYAGEIQCRVLGMRVEAWSDDGHALVDEVGELVVTRPSPSMPLHIWGDADGSRYRESYFDRFAGVWRHGDWITITSRGTAVIHGRSDSTLNRHGVRLGTADIYETVDRLPQVTESLVVGVELPDGNYYMPLFVVLAAGADLDDALRQEIVDLLRTSRSPRHVPDEILAVPAIPHTVTGKRLEVPIKRILQGTPVERAVNPGVVDDPAALTFFVHLAEHRAHANGSPFPVD